MTRTPPAGEGQVVRARSEPGRWNRGRLAAGLPVKDATSGFRAYRAEVLRAIDLESLDCNGPAILQQVLFRAHKLGFSVGEEPIHFVDRQAGRSTFNAAVALSGLAVAIRLRLRP